MLMEKKMQNSIKGDTGPVLFLQIKKIRKRRSMLLISTEAARESKCRTSEGYGRSMVRLTVWGRFTAKLLRVGLISWTGTLEPPPILENSCCLADTAWGKSSRGLIYLAVKNT